MGRLFALLYRFRNLILFLLLEAVAAGILFRYNQEQHSALESVMIGVSGRMNAVKKEVTTYARLGRVNQQLSRDIAALRQEVDGLRSDLARKAGVSPHGSYGSDSLNIDSMAVACDTVMNPKDYYYIPCRAVDNTIQSSYNHIIVNVGAEDGVKQEMGIVSPRGVAGMITYVSDHYALGMSMLNKKFRLSAKIKHSNITGTIRWEGGDTQYGSLDYIPLHYQPQVGDTVITSNYSTLFPEGYLIGRIATIEDAGKKGFFDIRVELFTEFSRLDYLYLVRSQDKAEIDSLRQIAQEQ
jgi:rod shape-determining protein MreC